MDKIYMIEIRYIDNISSNTQFESLEEREEKFEICKSLLSNKKSRIITMDDLIANIDNILYIRKTETHKEKNDERSIFKIS